jgi:hypothetical protein
MQKKKGLRLRDEREISFKQQAESMVTKMGESNTRFWSANPKC